MFELYSSRLDHGGGPRSLCDRGRRPMFVSLPGLAPVGGLDGEAAMRCCKGNYAFYVKINMPVPGQEGEAANWDNLNCYAVYAVTMRIPRNNGLDTSRMCGIIIFTQRWTVPRGADARKVRGARALISLDSCVSCATHIIDVYYAHTRTRAHTHV